MAEDAYGEEDQDGAAEPGRGAAGAAQEEAAGDHRRGRGEAQRQGQEEVPNRFVLVLFSYLCLTGCLANVGPP